MSAFFPFVEGNAVFSAAGLGRVQREAGGWTEQPGRVENPATLRSQQESGVQGGDGASPAGHLRAVQGVPPRPHQRAG